MYSNCHIEALRRFQRGETDTIVFTRTRYSLWERVAKTCLWRMTLYPLSVLIIYPLMLAVQVFVFLMSGCWIHVSWVDPVTGHRLEFVPAGEKKARWFVPPLFKGHVRDAGTACEDARKSDCG